MKGFNHLFANVVAGHTFVNNAAVAPGAVVPGVIPTAPGPSDVFKEGADCLFKWNPDPAGLWKETNVELMTGDNWNMVHLTTVTTFDGTDPSKTEFTYPCPDVEPNSAIYFYQFSSPAAPKNLTWTTRFTIAAADGKTTPPANDTQPDGQKISWGLGALVDPSEATPPPSYLGGASNSLSSTTTSDSSTSSSLTSSSSSAADAITDATTPTTTNGAGRTVTNTVSAAPTGNPQNQTGNGASGDNSALGAQANLAVGALAMCLTAVVFGVMS